jgi:hypothetical protein
MVTKTYARILDGEHVIEEANGLMSREQILLEASATPYLAGTILAKRTAGANAGQWTKFNPAGADGAATAKGVLFARRPASTGTQRAVAHVRDSDINIHKVTWGAAATDNQKATAIAALNARAADGYGNVRIRG